MRGPNVMQGYLNRPEKTAEVLRDGWYNTGDIAALDEEGFISHHRPPEPVQQDRRRDGASHQGRGQAPRDHRGSSEQIFAVTAVPDERKGERLIVLHTLPEDKLQDCLGQLAKSDLPALWKAAATINSCTWNRCPISVPASSICAA